MGRLTVPGLLLIALAAGFVLSSGTGSAQEVFSFYGLKFGMTKEEAGQVMSLVGDGFVRKPGYGMSSLQLVFDEEGRLMEIRADYPRPGEQLRLEGLKRAVNQRFLVPIRSSYPDIAASTDEYGNRATLTLVMVSKGIREKNIERFKNGFLMDMELSENPAQEKSP